MIGHSNWDSYEVVRIGLSGPGAVYVILGGPSRSGVVWGLSGPWWF